MCRGFNFPPKCQLMPYSYNKGEAQPVHLHSLISSCFVASMSMPVGIVNMVAKPQTQFYSLYGSCVH